MFIFYLNKKNKLEEIKLQVVFFMKEKKSPKYFFYCEVSKYFYQVLTLADCREVIFVENKNTDRLLRNANYGKEQVFVANKDTNRETLPVLASPKSGAVLCSAVPEPLGIFTENFESSQVGIIPSNNLFKKKTISKLDTL